MAVRAPCASQEQSQSSSEDLSATNCWEGLQTYSRKRFWVVLGQTSETTETSTPVQVDCRDSRMRPHVLQRREHLP